MALVIWIRFELDLLTDVLGFVLFDFFPLTFFSVPFVFLLLMAIYYCTWSGMDFILACFFFFYVRRFVISPSCPLVLPFHV